MNSMFELYTASALLALDSSPVSTMRGVLYEPDTSWSDPTAFFCRRNGAGKLRVKPRPFWRSSSFIHLSCLSLFQRLLYRYLAFGPTTTSSADCRSFACGRCISDMDIQDTQRLLSEYLQELANLFQRLPGSAIFLRYVKSSYQNDPVRSAVELFLFLFAVRYLLAPKYSTKPGVVKLSEDEIDDLVDEWTPEPLVGEPSAVEEMEVDKRTVIVGYGEPFWSQSSLC